MSTIEPPPMLPVISSKYRSLGLWNPGLDSEWLEVQPVLAWLLDESGRVGGVVTPAGLYRRDVEMPEGTIIRIGEPGVTWATRARWAADIRHAAQEGVEVDLAWFYVRRRREAEQRRNTFSDVTRAKADEFDRLGVPLDATRPQAVAMLRAAGVPVGRSEVLTEALRYRRERATAEAGDGAVVAAGG